jgi:hypothetical protein
MPGKRRPGERTRQHFGLDAPARRRDGDVPGALIGLFEETSQ